MFYVFKDDKGVESFLSPNLLPESGALVEFHGVVRNHDEGKAVKGLLYEAHESMAIKEGEKIFQEALTKFKINAIYGWHRYGYLKIGESAVKVFVEASHRKEAFEACMYAMDEIKKRLPIWKKEEYLDGENHWIAPKK